MKSKISVPAHLGQKQSELLKNSSSNFLENERYHTVIERGHVDRNLQIPDTSLSTKENSQSYEKLTSTKMTEQVQQKTAKEIALSNERLESGVFAPKRYVTTCYFQPKQVPVSYSETMIVKIGSKKKQFFESVYCENKLIPFHWTEKMTTIIPGSGEPVIFQSDVHIPVAESDFHYMSLEAQQEMAKANQSVDVNYV